MLIHGKKDSVIPWTHSHQLLYKCKSPAKLIAPKNMEHNKFEIFGDLISNLKDFFSLFLEDKGNEIIEFERLSLINSLKSNGRKSNPFSVNFPKFMFESPFEFVGKGGTEMDRVD